MSPFIIFLFLGGYYIYGAAIVIALLGMYEFYKTMKLKNIHTIDLAGYLLSLVYFLIFLKGNMSSAFIFLIIVNMLVLCIPVLNPKYNFVDVAVTVFAFLYIAVPFSYIPLLSFKGYGRYLVWLPFVCAWTCDTFAYYTGKKFGKIKLCPLVSPKKTVEGAVGGFFGCIASTVLYGIIINSVHYIIPIYNYIIIGALCGVLCQFGDLVASSIKRYIGTKDFSDLIPGHGGILDRFDSILFASIVVYYYITFIMVM